MNLFSWKHTVLMSIIHAITITQETRFAGLGVWVIGDGAGATAVARRAAAIVASAPERRARARCYGLHLCRICAHLCF